MRVHHSGFEKSALTTTAILVVVVAGSTSALAGDRRVVAPRPSAVRVYVPSGATVSVPSARVAPGAVNNYGRLGSFYPTPYLMVRGNAPAGGGYSPLGTFGETSMTLYGPLSPYRMTTAPVLTYTRGYDGRVVVAPGTSFSTPNLPALTPVVYPTQASNYFGFRQSGSPPWWANAINWLDQN
jgi:hypothetical protein